MMAIPDLRWATDRILARPATSGDAQVVFENYASDPEVAKYMTWRPHRDVAETLEFLKRCERVWVDGSACPWSLRLKNTGEFVGFCEIRVHSGAVDWDMPSPSAGGDTVS